MVTKVESILQYKQTESNANVECGYNHCDALSLPIR